MCIRDRIHRTIRVQCAWRGVGSSDSNSAFGWQAMSMSLPCRVGSAHIFLSPGCLIEPSSWLCVSPVCFIWSLGLSLDFVSPQFVGISAKFINNIESFAWYHSPTYSRLIKPEAKQASLYAFYMWMVVWISVLVKRRVMSWGCMNW